MSPLLWSSSQSVNATKFCSRRFAIREHLKIVRQHFIRQLIFGEWPKGCTKSVFLIFFWIFFHSPCQSLFHLSASINSERDEYRTLLQLSASLSLGQLLCNSNGIQEIYQSTVVIVIIIITVIITADSLVSSNSVKWFFIFG